MDERDRINAALAGPKDELRERQALLQTERERENRAIKNPLGTAELVGPSPELEVRPCERRDEKQQLVSDLAEIDANLNGQQLEISNEVLVYLGGS